MNNRDFQYSTTPTTAPQLQFTATGDRYLVLADGQIGNAAGTAFDAIMYFFPAHRLLASACNPSLRAIFFVPHDV